MVLRIVDLDGSKILVTGGAGFIGFHLCKELLNNYNANIVVLDNLSTGDIKNIQFFEGELEFIQGDIRNLSIVKKAAKDSSFIFHLAAQSSVPNSVNIPDYDFEVNARGTLNVLIAGKENNAKVIYASTGTVYGIVNEIPTSESHVCAPISFYGLSKWIGEEYCRLFYKIYDLPAISLRLFNVYAERTNKGVMFDFLQKIKNDPTTLEILGTGQQSKDFIYVLDSIEAFILVAQSDKADGQTYNVGSGTSTKVIDLAKMMLKKLGLSSENVKLKFKGGEAWIGDQPLTHADLTKIKSELGFNPKVSLSEGLNRFIKWFENSYGHPKRNNKSY